MTKLMTLILSLAVLLVPTPAGAEHVRSPKAGVDLQTKKVAHIVGKIDADSLSRFETEMLTTMHLTGDRLIVINSPGGLVVAGDRMQVLLDIERETGVRIVCVVVGNAHGMAFNILTRCDVRLALPASTMLVHKIRYLSHLNCDAKPCTARALRAWAKDLDRDDDKYRRANAEAMGLSLEKYDRYADAETEWTAEKLLKRGYLHGLATLEK